MIESGGIGSASESSLLFHCGVAVAVAVERENWEVGW